ncbi:MAG: efflux transporter outer membrane subunit [Sphingomonadaceae bacterium]|nr:efflux transporter outer membrane subunit [Sphingomonadaceae bacterium]
MRRMRAALAAGLLGAITGCSFEPSYERPHTAVPPAWPSGPAYEAATAGLPAARFADVVRDPKLVAVVNLALAHNQNLAAALANVELARGQYRITRAAQFPAISAGGQLTLAQGGSSAAGAIVGDEFRSIYSVNLGLAAFELDLFGRLRSQTRAAIANYLATDLGVASTRLTLVAEVANAFLVLAADRSLLRIAEDTQRVAAQSVELTRARLQGGVAPRSDLAQAQTIEATARSAIASQTTQVAQDLNALELLTGVPIPRELQPTGIEEIDGALGDAPAGLSSEILLRRPDVLAAEYRLRGANASIGAARAAFFPRISLTAATGFLSPALAGLFNDNRFTWQVAPSVTVPIFQGGALRGNLAVARGNRNLALAQYQFAIQNAFRDVTNALARRGTIEAQLAADRAREAAALDTLNLTTARYRGGIDPFLTTLDAQRTLFTARQVLVATRLTRAANRIELYRAIGGDELTDPLPLSGRHARAEAARMSPPRSSPAS